MRVHFACIFLSFSGPLTVWSVSISDCFYSLCLVVVLSKVVELAGVEPADTSYARTCCGWMVDFSASIE